jgi:uncharacterized membrane protein
MKLFFLKLYDSLTDSFWFVPAVMALMATAAALGLVALDHAIGSEWVKNIGWVWSGGPDGARAVLSVIAGSVMTVVSIVFSLTISTLAQTSSHYGPRVLRNFTSDRGVQFTLGTYIATFVYCLLVLRTVRSVQESTFVPYLSVTVGILFALVSLAVLIYFIHFISQSIQAENLIDDVGRAFQRALPTLFPADMGEDAHRDDPPGESFWEKSHPINSNKIGYLQRIDEAQIMALARDHNLQLKLEKRPGDFVAKGAPLFRVLTEAALADETTEALRGCISLGGHRTPHQDPLYSLQQLVEIAAHALSPGINEPFTALICIDWLEASLRGVALCKMPTSERYDDKGHLRVVARALTFDEVAHTAFDQVRIYGANNPDILIGILNAIAGISTSCQRSADRATLVHHAQLVEQDSAQIVNKVDRERVTDHLQRTIQVINQVNR